MHEADTAIVRRTRESEPGTWLDYLVRKLAAVGAPDDHLAPLRAARSGGRLRTLPGLRAALPDREIVPGELLDLAGRRLRAVWTPGHTRATSASIWRSGIPPGWKGTGGCSPATTCCRGSVRTSGCTRTRTTPPSPIRSATTSPRWSGSAGSGWPRCCPPTSTPSPTRAGGCRELLDHHEERLTGLLALLATPLTPWQLAERMEWNRPWEQIPHGSRSIAVSEAESHLRRLVKLGRAEAVPGGPPVTYIAV